MMLKFDSIGNATQFTGNLEMENLRLSNENTKLTN